MTGSTSSDHAACERSPPEDVLFSHHRGDRGVVAQTRNVLQPSESSGGAFRITDPRNRLAGGRAISAPITDDQRPSRNRVPPEMLRSRKSPPCSYRTDGRIRCGRQPPHASILAHWSASTPDHCLRGFPSLFATSPMICPWPETPCTALKSDDQRHVVHHRDETRVEQLDNHVISFYYEDESRAHTSSS